jgi:hypothetical protein
MAAEVGDVRNGGTGDLGGESKIVGKGFEIWESVREASSLTTPSKQ